MSYIAPDIYAMTKEENIFCAKRILVDSIYKQANLEGIGITYAQTQDILNNVNVSSLKPNEISKVCCLRDTWKFLLENIDTVIHLGYLQELHELVARFDVEYTYLGKWRQDDVMISGTNWRPELPNTDKLYLELKKHLDNPNITDRALRSGLWIMRTQPFKDGNKRVGSFLINKILIENGKGIFNVPVELDGIFKQLLVNYYSSNDIDCILQWITENCIQGTTKVETVFNSIPETTRHLYGDTKEEIVNNYLREHQNI